MEREEALQKINLIVGQDLRLLADKYQVTVFKKGNKNKGWAGHVIERYLGLPINSSQSPNYGSWELKTISLKYLQSGKLTVKETMAITMIDPYNVERTSFEHSHLLAKLNKIVIAGRIWVDKKETTSILHSVKTFDLDNPQIYAQIKEDYLLVQKLIKTEGFSALHGKYGKYIQPRTKGARDSKTRAFYVRVPFLKQVIFPNLS